MFNSGISEVKCCNLFVSISLCTSDSVICASCRFLRFSRTSYLFNNSCYSGISGIFKTSNRNICTIVSNSTISRTRSESWSYQSDSIYISKIWIANIFLLELKAKITILNNLILSIGIFYFARNEIFQTFNFRSLISRFRSSFSPCVYIGSLTAYPIKFAKFFSTITNFNQVCWFRLNNTSIGRDFSNPNFAL